MMWFLSLFLWSRVSAGRAVESIASPRADPQYCWPNGNLSALPSWVCDPDGYINNSTMYALNDQINYLYLSIKTKCNGAEYGDQIGVLIIKAMTYTSFWETKENAAQRYAKAIHDAWGVGAKDCNNGAMLFVSVDDRQVYISTGAGVKDKLSQSKLQNVVNDMKPHFKHSDYNSALMVGVKGMIYYLEQPASLWDEVGNLFLIGAIVIIGVCALVMGCDYLRSVIRRRSFDEPSLLRTRAYEKDHKKLEQLKKDLQQKKKIEASMCPICLGDFEDDEDGHLKQSETDVEAGQEAAGAVVSSREILCCGHQFHQSCITTWLQKKNECPICREANPREPPLSQDDSPLLKTNEAKQTQVAYYDDAFYNFAYSNHRTRYIDVIAWHPSPWNVLAWNSYSTNSTTYSSSSAPTYSGSLNFGSSSWSSGGSFGGGVSFGGGGFGGSW